MSKTAPQTSQLRGDQTRESLLAAATSAFAREGFHGVSTRRIAELAGTNQALIGYHFGGKEKLYLAVIEHVTSQMRSHVDPFLAHIEAMLEEVQAVPDAAERRTRLLPALFDLTDGMVALLMQERSAEWMQLILGEQQAPSPGFDVLYDGLMGRIAELIAAVAGMLRVDQDETANRMLAVTIMGQMIVFRSARAGVLRHLGWNGVDDAGVGQVQQFLRANLTALLTPRI